MKRWRTIADTIGVRLQDGYPSIVNSDDWRGLKPGFHVVVLGICDSVGATRLLGRLKRDNPGVYARETPALGRPLACPKTVALKTTNPDSLKIARKTPVVLFERSTAPVRVVGTRNGQEVLQKIFAGDTKVRVAFESCPDEDEDPGASCVTGEELRVFRGQRLILQVPMELSETDPECTTTSTLRDLTTAPAQAGLPDRLLASYDWNDGGCAAIHARAESLSGGGDESTCETEMPDAERLERASYEYVDGVYVFGGRD
ncbi:MAG: hypothetical protein A2289_18360 [Deltaproteobacteria bacterium RIFOXYA12_FULL_58_15]|nr:MAG: hypothetical protein A2289_18360 [Deltaproteobacteria bacterium RIFOXYA12_FULL_58_15]OGR15092.1 MAG: hypothetical protein A2341_03790 [Deltaproteobacteria bacterium RIFOXYB12_FULL_58_9]